MDLRLSKNKVRNTVNDRTYKMSKWSTITTTLEGMKLAKVIAPSFAMVSDMWMGKDQNKDELDLILEDRDQNMYLLTGAVTQLCSSLEDEHFMSLVDKLLSGLEIIKDDEAVKIEDWSEHFDEFPEDYDQIVMWSIKENLWDFFMKQDTFASKIKMVTKILTPMADQMQKLASDD